MTLAWKCRVAWRSVVIGMVNLTTLVPDRRQAIMKRIMVFAILTATSLCGCADTGAPAGKADKVPGPWVATSDGKTNITAADRERCSTVGGEIRQTGFINFSCVYPAPDAGKHCSDGSQCTGKCLAPEETEPNVRAEGKCSDMVNRGGCANFIINGVATGVLCVD